jgi:CHAD domain-containing protein
MNDQDALLDRSPEAAARTLALALLDDAAAAAGHLRSDTDVDALHDFRVALRRLRSLLRSYRSLLLDSVSKKQARALRDLAGSTGGARDAEVQLEWLTVQHEQLKPGARKAWSWLMERLESRRDAAYSAVRGDVPARFSELETRLRSGLSRYSATVSPATSRAIFARAVGKQVRRTGRELVAALGAVRAASEVEAAHHARIQGKRLRYLIEPLENTTMQPAAERLVGSIKAMQDVLGRLHDMHVLAAEIAASLVEVAAERARTLHEALYSGDPAPPGRDLRSGIMAIDRLVRDRVEELFQELRAGWGGARLAPFSEEVEALAEALCRHGSRAQRRRFLLASLPALEARPLEVAQGWIPGLRLQERLKRAVSGGEERYYLVKNGSERELEEEASRAVFERLWSLTEGRQVLKRTYRIEDGERVWEVDDFLDRDLVLAGTELHGPTEQVELPDWLRPLVVREVTGEDQYLDESLAR